MSLLCLFPYICKNGKDLVKFELKKYLMLMMFYISLIKSNYIMLSYPGLLLRQCNLYAWKDWVARTRLILYCKKQLLYNIFLVAVLDQRCLFLLLIFVLKLGCEIFIGLPFFFFFFFLTYNDRH